MQLIKKARTGDLKAISDLLDRLEGKPAQAETGIADLNVKFEVVNKVPEPSE